MLSMGGAGRHKDVPVGAARRPRDTAESARSCGCSWSGATPLFFGHARLGARRHAGRQTGRVTPDTSRTVCCSRSMRGFGLHVPVSGTKGSACRRSGDGVRTVVCCDARRFRGSGRRSASLFTVGDAVTAARQLAQVLDDEVLRSSLIAAGPLRPALFHAGRDRLADADRLPRLLEAQVENEIVSFESRFTRHPPPRALAARPSRRM